MRNTAQAKTQANQGLYDPRAHSTTEGERQRLWGELSRKSKSAKTPVINRHFDDGRDEVVSEYSRYANPSSNDYN